MLQTLSLFADECAESHKFFGLEPWYHFINDKAHFTGCDIIKFNILPPGSDIPLVLLAIIDDLLRIAGIVALAFVIVGAFRFITAQGNSEGAAQAQNTIINALVGLAIAITAVALITFLGNKLGGP